MNDVPTTASPLAARARGIAVAGWLIIAMAGVAALLPLFEQEGGAVIIGSLLIASGLAELFAGTLRHEAKRLSILNGVVAIIAGALFATGPASQYFMPSVVIVIGWLILRSILLFLAARVTDKGVRWWTTLSAITDALLAALLIIGIPIASLVLGLFGATTPLVAAFAWILALSFITDGLMLLEIASASRQTGEKL